MYKIVYDFLKQYLRIGENYGGIFFFLNRLKSGPTFRMSDRGIKKSILGLAEEQPSLIPLTRTVIKQI